MAETDRRFFEGLARACGGAVFFALPLLMTMEMWWLGFYMDRLRLALFMVLMVPVLVILDRYSGFEDTASWSEDLLDGFVSFGVGIATAAAILFLFGIITLQQPLREVVGKVALESVPASFGAVLANSLLVKGDRPPEQERRIQRAGYPAELFLMCAGAIFLAFNVAPTEEMVLIAYIMTPWHAVAVAVASLLMMHAFVFALNFRGSHAPEEGRAGWGLFLRFTVPGYAIALVVSAYVLWTFGRFDGGATGAYVMVTLVLGFPASLGAAAARLII